MDALSVRSYIGALVRLVEFKLHGGISQLLRGNENSPRRAEIKLRKNEIISPKSFPSPHWIIRDLHQGIFYFLHSEVDELIIYNVSPMPPNIESLTSSLYLHIFTGKFVRFPPFSNIHVENLKSVLS